MSLSPLAGKIAPTNILDNIEALISAYYELTPDLTVAEQQVSFGTSGHRGCSLKRTFNQTHVAAICQALVEFRQQNNITGPLYIGMDSHALSAEAQKTAIEVFVANEQQVIVQSNGLYTPTPVISHAILVHNKNRTENLADGIVITPSHNPPQDGGLKYNLAHGGPADTDSTGKIQQRANELIKNNLVGVKRLAYAEAVKSTFVNPTDLIYLYVATLDQVINMQAIKDANIKIGVDPMGGASVDYWQPIAEYYDLDISVVNKNVDPAFSFMSCDHDGKIRMDCSSPYAMAGLIDLKDNFDLAFGGGGHGQGFQQKGEDQTVKVLISLEEAIAGTQKSLTIQMPKMGAGGHYSHQPKTIKVKIPAGVKQGSKIRLSGQGMDGSNGGPKGDLYLEVDLQNHPLYKVDGNDIILNLPVTPWEAALGAKVEIPTLKGKVAMNIAPGSKSGSKLRIKGRGLGKGTSLGNQLVIIQIHTPPAKTAEQKEFYKQMKSSFNFNPRQNF